ncbi:putative E3 ubiquitin-protein ligase XBAT34 isoform X2 [Argentina anserina]|uniref:putative E3 ubiquitin-protein ligase XBAT34 isoform X2 n=1 Tax=Argentina anserina TaxID=57926 RepID=UPI00217674E3|nr:putative E3 ubiquitin-protein ligase XBAT34 isoform X2 [Potentilla anserina]
MGLQQSKEELLYDHVGSANVDGIKSLHSQGAGLEWIDREGKTPLIVACMNPGLTNVAKTLIELGANVNAYRPGRQAGTPLHHAAKRGLEETVNLLLSRGANVLIMNDDCQSPLDVARAKGHSNVVRAIEGHICLFSGWLREFYGPGFLEVLAPQLVSRKVWAVVLPCGSRKPTKPYKLELAIYSSLQDAQPRTVIGLWKVNLEEPKSHLSDPSVIIHDISSKARIRLASGNESDKQQLQWFTNACKGIPQSRPAFLGNNNPATAPPATAEDVEAAMTLSASLQSASQERPPFPDAHPTYASSASGSSSTSTGASNLNGWSTSAESGSYNSWGAPIAGASSKVSSSDWSGVQTGPVGSSTGHAISSTQTAPTSEIVVSSTQSAANPSAPPPSAPPVLDESLDEYPIAYPSIDDSPIDLSNPTVESTQSIPPMVDEKKGDEVSSSCVICLDAPVEGACIPCGHMAGCMSCLTEIKGKKWGCPVCRAKIEQVVRLYAV